MIAQVLKKEKNYIINGSNGVPQGEDETEGEFFESKLEPREHSIQASGSRNGQEIAPTPVPPIWKRCC